MEKNFVAIEGAICPICGQKFETGALILNKQMKKVFDRVEYAGYEPCESCQKKIEEGFVSLIVINNDHDETKTMTFDKAERTGDIIWMKRSAFEQLFQNYTNTNIAFIDKEVKTHIENIYNQIGE